MFSKTKGRNQSIAWKLDPTRLECVNITCAFKWSTDHSWNQPPIPASLSNPGYHIPSHIHQNSHWTASSTLQMRIYFCTCFLVSAASAKTTKAHTGTTEQYSWAQNGSWTSEEPSNSYLVRCCWKVPDVDKKAWLGRARGCLLTQTVHEQFPAWWALFLTDHLASPVTTS